jgi:hypothetical protein
MNESKTLSRQAMFDNLKEMFDFIMVKMNHLEEKIDKQSDRLNEHVNDEEGKLSEHSIILRIIVWLSAAIAVPVIGFAVKYLFDTVG